MSARARLMNKYGWSCKDGVLVTSENQVDSAGWLECETMVLAARDCRSSTARIGGRSGLSRLPPLRAETEETDLFIDSGFRFQCVNAFAGRQRILNTYREAIRQGCQFRSFGDRMLIL